MSARVFVKNGREFDGGRLLSRATGPATWRFGAALLGIVVLVADWLLASHPADRGGAVVVLLLTLACIWLAGILAACMWMRGYEHGVLVRNGLRIWWVPWSLVEGFTAGTTLAIQVEDRRPVRAVAVELPNAPSLVPNGYRAQHIADEFTHLAEAKKATQDPAALSGWWVLPPIWLLLISLVQLALCAIVWVQAA